MKSSRRWWVLLVVLILLAVGHGVYDLETHTNLVPLGARARRVASIESAPSRYWWVSENEVLLLRRAAPQDATLIRLNIDNGAETPLPALSELFLKSVGRPETLRVSPRGDRALWTGERNITYVSTLDGRRYDHVQETGSRINIWNGDGSGWFALYREGGMVDRAREYDLKNPYKPRVVNPIAFPFPDDPDKVNLDHIASIDDEHILAPGWLDGRGKLDRVLVVITPFGANPSQVKRLTFTPPYLNSGGELAFSPISDLLAWRLDVQLPRVQFWRDLGIGSPSRYSVAFCVTKEKTAESVSLGYLDADRNDPDSRPIDLQLSPFGESLSFVQHKSLWVVSTK